MANTRRFIKLIRGRVGSDKDRVIYEPVIVSKEDFHLMLRRKLMEEALEYFENESWDELIDVYEVVRSLCELHGRTISILADDASRVRHKKGGFTHRMAMWVERADAD